MNTTHHNHPKKLPFDILGLIFSHYASSETIHSPLETLLLVSREWNEAAVNHPTLWTNLKIYLGHNPTSTIWLARLPRRLERCGPVAPLYIDLRNYLDMPTSDRAQDEAHRDSLYLPMPCAYTSIAPLGPVELSHEEEDEDELGDICSCLHIAREAAVRALVMLAGENGVLCARWKRFELDLGHYPWVRMGDRRVAQALSYPTPNLQELVLRNLQLDEFECSGLALFPDTGYMTSIAAYDSDISSFPKLDKVIRATFVWEQSGSMSDGVDALQHATQLQQLHLSLPADFLFRLPAQLPNLMYLQLDGDHVPKYLYTCEMPVLSKLVLELNGTDTIGEVRQFRGLNPLTLRSLVVNWKHARRTRPDIQKGIMQSLAELLAQCSNLQTIEMGGWVLSLLLRLLWQMEDAPALQSLIQRRQLVNLDRGLVVRFGGDEDKGFFERLARDWGLASPTLADQRFFRLTCQ